MLCNGCLRWFWGALLFVFVGMIAFALGLFGHWLDCVVLLVAMAACYSHRWFGCLY